MLLKSTNLHTYNLNYINLENNEINSEQMFKYHQLIFVYNNNKEEQLFFLDYYIFNLYSSKYLIIDKSITAFAIIKFLKFLLKEMTSGKIKYFLPKKSLAKWLVQWIAARVQSVVFCAGNAEILKSPFFCAQKVAV